MIDKENQIARGYVPELVSLQLHPFILELNILLPEEKRVFSPPKLTVNHKRANQNPSTSESIWALTDRWAAGGTQPGSHSRLRTRVTGHGKLPIAKPCERP